MSKPLVVVGSINADLYVEIARMPAIGETILGEDGAIRAGGKGANQAAAAARLGVETWFIGNLGSDAFAPPLRLALEGAGVTLDLLSQVDGPTGQAFVLLQKNGQNSIIVIGGANQSWSGLSDEARGRIRDSGGVLLQREIPDEINMEAAHIAHDAGVPVILDAGGADRPFDDELLKLVTVLSPNESELGRLTGLPTATNEQVVSAARALHAKGVESVLVKLGDRGTMLVPRKGSVLVHGIFRVPVIDSTGAGDCFTAAYAAATVGGMSETARLRFASAAAALCVQKKGALGSMPSRELVKKFLQTRSFEAVPTDE